MASTSFPIEEIYLHNDTPSIWKTINPYSQFRKIWEYVMFALSIFTLWELPYTWVFDIPLSKSYVLPMLIVDSLYAADVYISQNTGFMEFGIIEMNPTIIHMEIPIWRKVFFWITPIPLYLIGFIMKNLKVYRILISYKLIRVIRLVNCIHTMRNTLIYVSPISKMVVLFAFLFTLDHFFTCIFWFTGHKELPGPSWLSDVAGIVDETQFVQYFHTFYYITTTVLTIGYGDLHPYTFIEICIIIGVEAIGVFYYNFFVSNMVSVVADPSRNSFLEKYQKVYSAFKNRGVSNESILELLRYYEFVWERSRDEPDFYETASKMPESLQLRIALALHMELFNKVDSFRELGSECLEQVAMKLRPRVFTPGDFLIKAGSVSKRMYFISNGKVDVLNSCGSFITSYDGSTSGIVFGEASLINGTEEVTCVIAETYVEAYELTKTDFDEIHELHEGFRKARLRRLNPNNVRQQQSPRIAHLSNLQMPPP